MSDPELEAIRAARMNQLQQESGGPGAGNDEAAQQRAAEEEMRRNLLATVLDTAARERLSRIALVSQDRARQIEAILLRMAQTGQLRGRVTEQQLIDLLEKADDAQGKSHPQKGAIVYQRRKDAFDDDDF
ncbi:DNA-binding TFAR19-related protein [Irpex rosettiformis]|uniref:DNA-binding TFAR19-related protein n=1 Tax=Irpex rosettiformis TaxID=378272 RepID=A0ACB8UIE4_9APHY|nr:DNA-binding TFAR19-related protein [Irpex rosettiformis]